MSGGPASAGLAKNNTAATVTSERVNMVMIECLLGSETEPTP